MHPFLANIIESLKFLNGLGFWDMLTFLAIPISFLVWKSYKKRMSLFSVHISYYCDTGHELFPNTLNFEVRNLMDSPLVVSRPNFRFTKKLKSGNNAHGNSATGDFEIKFRPVDEKGRVKNGYSYTSLLLRHRDSVFAYVPFDDALTDDDFKELIHENKCLGYLFFHVVVLKESKPIVTRLKIPIKNIKLHPHIPPLGQGALPNSNIDTISKKNNK